MSIEFRMPALGADMEYGTLLEWKVAPGALVQRGDVVAVVETDKGAIDVEIFDAGRVEALLVEPGTRVAVGAVLARLAGAPGGAAAAPPSAGGPEAPAPEPAPPPAARERVSPAARAHAKKLGVDLAAVAGSGPNGAITFADVERAAAGAQAAPRAGGGGMRAVIAAAMARSKREIPHYYASMSVDWTAARAWLEAHNASVAVTQRILPVVPLLRAVALAAAQSEGFNGWYVDGAFQPSRGVHLGVATSLRGGGLVTPAILDAQDKPLVELMRALHDVVDRARSGRLRASELAAGTLTVSSLGEEGVDALLPIIYPPQVAIVGAGSLSERPAVVAGRVEARAMLTLTLAADHRVSDGRAGARFLARVRDLLQDPQRL
jgi:pyruvate dehydrogenase E2 component (dihydrolipoamide acetyltransferase)